MKTKIVIVRLEGGLGNQLFQYSLGRKLSLMNNSILFIDDFEYSKNKLRHFSLSYFNCTYKILPSLVSKFINSNGRITNTIKDLFFNKFIKIIKEKDFLFNSELLLVDSNVYLSGFFQSPKYFQGIHHLIIQELKDIVPSALSNEYLELSNHINKNKLVGIHLRRGDYFDHEPTKNFFGILDIKYYNRAISQFNENTKYIVFSDDYSIAKKVFSDGRFVFVSDFIASPNEIGDFFCMSVCQSNVIANSTFSWWAAFINCFNDPDKKVFYPKNWFHGELSTIDNHDLIPDFPNWVGIDN